MGHKVELMNPREYLPIRRAGRPPALLDHFCRLLVPFMLVLSFHGCAVTKKQVRTEPPVPQGLPERMIERNNFSPSNGDSVIGRPAFIRLLKGDTLPDVARHFGLGTTEISAANPEVDICAPDAEERVLLPLSHVLPDCPRKGIVINLAAMRLFQFKDNGRVSTYPVGIGTRERPSPMGPMYVRAKTVRPTWVVPLSIAEDHRKKGDPLPARVPPGPQNPLGEYALYLSRPSYLIHGTNKPYSIGLNATNGCIRLYPEDVGKLYGDTPVHTPVRIVDQPYLVGQRNGVIYVEVHAPPEGDRNSAELHKMFAKLKALAESHAWTIDWNRVEETVAEARGIPVPVSGTGRENEREAEQIVLVRHPGRLYGRPELPEMRMDAWYVSAGSLDDRDDAVRLAAIINHQGPQIPARVLPKSTGYRVLAGPFADADEARDAMKRLKIDLKIEGLLVEPPGTNNPPRNISRR
jgi:L,D-transpeptidase ErfK/SrfK